MPKISTNITSYTHTWSPIAWCELSWITTPPPKKNNNKQLLYWSSTKYSKLFRCALVIQPKHADYLQIKILVTVTDACISSTNVSPISNVHVTVSHSFSKCIRNWIMGGQIFQLASSFFGIQQYPDCLINLNITLQNVFILFLF